MEYRFYLKKNLFKYEIEFAKKEILFYLNCSEVHEERNHFNVEVMNEIDNRKIKKLTYFDKVVNGNEIIIPDINYWEASTVKGRKNSRQSTRYFSHGIHEYKGKFNPQVVHSLILQNNLDKNDLIFDPFNGSGTTILEASLMGINSLGIDVNPLAILISNAKMDAMSIIPDNLLFYWKLVRTKVEAMCKSLTLTDDERIIYLKKWVPIDTLNILESIRYVVKSIPEELRRTVLILTSNVLRDYSFQDPGDLRIRRRRSIPEQMPILDKIEESLTKYVYKLKKFGEFYKDTPQVGIAELGDSKLYSSEIKPSIAMTSPPYASALPYIDTQRLSIVWLNLAQPREIKKLDSNLIGSRESSKKELKILDDQLNDNASDLPHDVHSYLMELKSSLTASDGFRRQATPALLYNYFSQMKLMFRNVYDYICPGSPYLLIVGKNKTTLGGHKFIIDTPVILSKIAKQENWKVEDVHELQTYARYGLNAKNSVNSESLITLRRS